MEKTAEVIIVGTGAAGLFCALQLPPTCHILLITKETAEESDSFLAQGGICTLKAPSDYASFFEDTMKAGHYENNKASVDIMIKSAPSVIQDLLAFGVSFDKEGEEFQYTREGAHSAYRILHHDDATGREITGRLLEEARRRPNIHILEHTEMVDILTVQNRCAGVVAHTGGGCTVLSAKAVVWATGGIGGLFRHSTNFRHITADALAISLKRGIATQNISYIQIHPTVLYSQKPGRRFLISESVRGEGAYLLNKAGQRFVDELLPRDAVTEAIGRQMALDGSDHVYLSVTHLPAGKIPERFPNIFATCREEGYDMRYDPIPVTPAQHYYMGGVQAGTEGQTSMEQLYAVGEAGCNGVHGKNRLASNSLLESLVFSKRAAVKISAQLPQIDWQHPTTDLSPYYDKERLHREYRGIIMEAIKRKDRDFYDKWCDHEDTNG